MNVAVNEGRLILNRVLPQYEIAFDPLQFSTNSNISLLIKL
jgi:hypothetical protein